MKPEDLVTQLRAAAPDTLRSVILYGSAATGEFVAQRSDYNLLVVLDRLGLPQLQALSAPTKAWVKAGHAPPLYFTEYRLRRSADVFPLELLDIKENHRVLWGVEVVADLEVSVVNLRHELEFELKSKLMHLRQRYLLTEPRSKNLTALLVETLSTFLVLFRGALRLFQPTVPAHKMEALRALSQRLDFPTDVFEIIQDLKTGKRRPQDVVPEELFQRYLSKIETVVDKVDQHLATAAEGGASETKA